MRKAAYNSRFALLREKCKIHVFLSQELVSLTENLALRSSQQTQSRLTYVSRNFTKISLQKVFNKIKFMKKILQILFLIISIAFFAQTKNLNFDGVYRTKCVRFNGSEYYTNFRFFPNGNVIYVSVNCDTTIEDLQKWFNEDFKSFGNGKYEIRNNKITGEVANIIFKGKLKQNKIKMKTFAYNVNNKEKELYTFIEFKK